MDDRITQLKKIKEEAGVSLERLAQKIGVSMFTVMRWTSGATKNPHRTALEALDLFFEKYEIAKSQNDLVNFFRARK